MLPASDGSCHANMLVESPCAPVSSSATTCAVVDPGSPIPVGCSHRGSYLLTTVGAATVSRVRTRAWGTKTTPVRALHLHKSTGKLVKH